MTPEEALKHIESHIEWKKPFWIAVKGALKAQVPKKPQGFHHCPNCASSLPAPDVTDEWCKCCYHPNYCPDCGQAIDWSDENDT